MWIIELWIIRKNCASRISDYTPGNSWSVKTSHTMDFNAFFTTTLKVGCCCGANSNSTHGY